MTDFDNFNIYWGDLHSHCSISYGQGTLEQALLRARQQLDFCSVTGHAFWPDMPTDRERYGEIIDYHRDGFETLAKNWPTLLQQQAAATEEGQFVALPSYEWHSLTYGDHNVYAPGPELPLRDGADLQALRDAAKQAGGMIVPHHIGYRAGFRGIDWNHFDASLSPIVEIYSLHGASVSTEADCPMLHDMGPRDAGSTAVEGWRRGHRFGIFASTDHHGGYPGSHGDGRAGVMARQLTRQGLWDALQSRRTYAVTGDLIEARMQVNGASVGDAINESPLRTVQLQIVGWDTIDAAELLRNESVVQRWHAPGASKSPTSADGAQRQRLRITWGWGRKDAAEPWQIQVQLSDGVIRKVDTAFSGQSVVAPKGVGGHAVAEDGADLPHVAQRIGDRQVEIRSVTMGNRSTRHPTTQSISLEVEASSAAVVTVQSSHGSWSHPLETLRHGGRSHYQRGWLSPALVIGPVTLAEDYCLKAEWRDTEPRTSEIDYYRLRVRQVNGQWAWLTPIWVN